MVFRTLSRHVETASVDVFLSSDASRVINSLIAAFTVLCAHMSSMLLSMSTLKAKRLFLEHSRTVVSGTASLQIVCESSTNLIVHPIFEEFFFPFPFSMYRLSSALSLD